MVKYKTISQFATESGYTEAAIRSKIADGTWPKGLVWRHAPDNKPLISVDGYAEWVESAAAFERRPKAALRSASCSRAPSAASASQLSPPPLI